MPATLSCRSQDFEHPYFQFRLQLPFAVAQVLLGMNATCHLPWRIAFPGIIASERRPLHGNVGGIDIKLVVYLTARRRVS